MKRALVLVVVGPFIGLLGIAVLTAAALSAALGGLGSGSGATAAAYGLTAPVGGAGSEAVEYALAQVGTPYEWGDETAGVGFDCSGLAQAAYASAGVGIPRVAQDQFDAGPAVPAGSPLQPGDLVFFANDAGAVVHVGLVVDPSGVMVDAPHSGAQVRVEPFQATVGAHWGSELYIGATSPGSVG